MADYGAYANPEILFDAQNVQLAANTVSSWRNNLSKNLENFTQLKKDQYNRIVANNERRRSQLDSASKSFNQQYIQAKNEADKFTSSLRGSGEKEAFNMSNQIQKALYEVGKKLNQQITDAGPDVSQFQIDQYTANAINEVTRLKNDMTNLYTAYTEYEAAKDLDPADPKALLANSNPEMQELFKKLDDKQDNVILSQDPSNGHWVLIPVDANQQGSYTELVDGTKVINYDKDIGIIDASDYSARAEKDGGYFEYVGGPGKDENILSQSKALSQDLIELSKQEQFSNFKRRIAEGAPATKEKGQLASDIQHLTEYDHEAIKNWLLQKDNNGEYVNIGYLDTYIPVTLDGALQQIKNEALTVDELALSYQDKLDQYYNALIDNALLRLPKSE